MRAYLGNSDSSIYLRFEAPVVDRRRQLEEKICGVVLPALQGLRLEFLITDVLINRCTQSERTIQYGIYMYAICIRRWRYLLTYRNEERSGLVVVLLRC